MVNRSSVLIQFIYEDMNFRSPILLTYISTSLLALHLPAHFVSEYLRHKRAKSTDEDRTALVSKEFSYEDLATTSISQKDQEGDVSHSNIIKAAVVIAPLWFVSNCLYNYSLLMTSVSSSTIIRFVSCRILHQQLKFICIQ